MNVPSYPRNPEIERLLKEAVAKYNAMSEAEREAMHKAQCESYVRAEMNWPRDCPYR